LEKLHTEELYDLYLYINIIRVSKSRMRWVGHMPCVGEKRNSSGVFLGKPE